MKIPVHELRKRAKDHCYNVLAEMDLDAMFQCNASEVDKETLAAMEEIQQSMCLRLIQ